MFAMHNWKRQLSDHLAKNTRKNLQPLISITYASILAQLLL